MKTLCPFISINNAGGAWVGEQVGRSAKWKSKKHSSEAVISYEILLHVIPLCFRTFL